MEYEIQKLKDLLHTINTVVIGAGSGLSTAAGFTYTNERFIKYFSDFIQKYHFTDMYTGGFYHFDTLEEYWAYWSRYVYINRYVEASYPVYKQLYDLVKNKDYFVLTTNVDHQFQKSGFSKERLFYTQGDYGLFQCSKPCHYQTYDNELWIKKMVNEQKNQKIPSSSIPFCPHCGKPMTMNLRTDMTFVEDVGWHQASYCYHNFLKTHENEPILYLEIGVGYNTPSIIKYPFWQMSAKNTKAYYVCINPMETFVPTEIKDRSICIREDIKETLEKIKEPM